MNSAVKREMTLSMSDEGEAWALLVDVSQSLTGIANALSISGNEKLSNILLEHAKAVRETRDTLARISFEKLDKAFKETNREIGSILSTLVNRS